MPLRAVLFAFGVQFDIAAPGPTPSSGMRMMVQQLIKICSPGSTVQRHDVDMHN